MQPYSSPEILIRSFCTVNTLLGSLSRPLSFIKVYQPSRFSPLNSCTVPLSESFVPDCSDLEDAPKKEQLKMIIEVSRIEKVVSNRFIYLYFCFCKLVNRLNPSPNLS